MTIEKYESNGIVRLRVVRTYRIKDANGKSVNRKEVIKSLGALSNYDDGEPDYLDRLRKSFAAKQPIIPELLPYVDYAPKEKISISFTYGNQYCIGAPKNFAPCVLDPAFAALGLDELFASIKHSSRIQYDLQGIVRLLIYGRLLEPASKMATMRQNDSYYRPLVKSSNDDNVYDTLDVIYENRKQIIQRMNSCISKGIGRNTSTVFYDVTNFFFETEQPDEDEVDEEGIVIEKGLRKMGVSKENRKQPIVQMGLFLDDNGIPISIEIFPGNTLDHLTFRTAMRNTVDILDMERFILIADRGMYNGTNMCHVLDQGNGYIVSKSLKKSTKKEREWVLDQEGYTLISKWPKSDPNSAYAQYFIGNSYLADMGAGVFNVTFEPRCRNNWHIHHKQVQMLICVAGRGWYQEWGKEPIAMTPGTVIAIPAEVKHWHGAACDSWFQHLTYHTNVQEGASNEWLEPVTDDIYNQLK